MTKPVTKPELPVALLFALVAGFFLTGANDKPQPGNRNHYADGMHPPRNEIFIERTSPGHLIVSVNFPAPDNDSRWLFRRLPFFSNGLGGYNHVGDDCSIMLATADKWVSVSLYVIPAEPCAGVPYGGRNISGTVFELSFISNNAPSFVQNR